MKTPRDWIFKFVLPLILLGIIAYGMITQTGLMNAEIPIDNAPDPWPLESKSCVVDLQKQGDTPPQGQSS